VCHQQRAPDLNKRTFVIPEDKHVGSDRGDRLLFVHNNA